VDRIKSTGCIRAIGTTRTQISSLFKRQTEKNVVEKIRPDTTTRALFWKGKNCKRGLL
jgi:hypothetical protein